MAEKKKVEKKKAFFRAILKLRNIAGDALTYRVHEIKGKGMDSMEGSDRIPELHHLKIARKEFPVDDDFSMNFMNLDLDAGNISGKTKKEKEEALEILKEKQAAFRKFMEFELVIR